MSEINQGATNVDRMYSEADQEQAAYREMYGDSDDDGDGDSEDGINNIDNEDDKYGNGIKNGLTVKPSFFWSIFPWIS